jgi:hypothetical protein
MFHAQLRPLRAAYLMAAAAAVVAASVIYAPPQAIGQEAPVLNPRHPQSYVVRPGDTLWDISAMFLREPWYWPEIWQINPQVADPHLIFPGDILTLVYLDDGRPVLQIERAGDTERLSPRIRSEALEDAIPTIPFDALRAFLSRPAVLDKDEMSRLPYLLTPREGLLGSVGRDVYVRGTAAPVDTVFNLVRAGDALIDPDDNTLIGYEGVYVGQGRLRRTGDPSTVHITDSGREARAGDYLMEEENITPMNFFPRAPESEIEGRIISVIDGVALIGQYQVVVLNRGANHGLEPGHVLRAWQIGEVVSDQVGRRGPFAEKVRLPDEPAGVMLVFRTFDRISYALIMEATNEIRVLDAVRNP